MQVWNYFNLRTFLAVAISQVATFLAIHYQIKFNISLTLFGLAVVFPLHFSIQAAFKRREKALEYFSLFKAGLMSLYYSINISEDLPAEKKTEGANLLKGIFDQVIRQLEHYESGYETVQRKMNELFAFMQSNREGLSKRNTIRMIKYTTYVSKSTVYLLSLTTHRTIAGLRFYSIFFILIFPLVHVPILLHKLDGGAPYWAIYIFAALTSLVLVTLNNFQKLIEYPFDPKGMDNIRLKEFKLDV